MAERPRPVAVRIVTVIIEILAGLQVLQWAGQALGGLGITPPDLPAAVGVLIVVVGFGLLAQDVVRFVRRNPSGQAPHERSQGASGNNLALTMRDGTEALAEARARMGLGRASHDDKRWSEATIHRFLDVMERTSTPPQTDAANPERQQKAWRHFLGKMNQVAQEYPRLEKELRAIQASCVESAPKGQKMMLLHSVGLILMVSRPYAQYVEETKIVNDKLSREAFLYVHLLYRNAITALMDLDLLLFMFLEEQPPELFVPERERFKQLKPSMKQFVDHFKTLEDEIGAQVEILDIVGA